jgi:hypothetical protein
VPYLRWASTITSVKLGPDSVCCFVLVNQYWGAWVLGFPHYEAVNLEI